MNDIRRRRDEALARCRREYQQSHPGSLYQTDNSVSMDEGAGEDTVDGLVVPPASKNEVMSSM